jgi:choline dehydrogenase
MPVGFLKALQRPGLTGGYESEPEPQLLGKRLPIPRGRLLGGSSSINGMFHIRGHRLDFDEWRDMGCEGWGYDDVLPYFLRSESNWRGASQYHGSQGPLQVRGIDNQRLLDSPLREAAIRAGHAVTEDYDGAQQDGYARGDVAIDARGRRSSSARAYLQPVRGRANLQLVTHARATRVLLEEGGAYNSPHLLMLSGIGPADQLAELGITQQMDLPGVGQNLMEHPRMMLMYRAKTPITFINQLRFDRATLAALQWAIFGRGPFATQVCSGSIMLKTQPHLSRPDIQLLCNPVRFDAGLWFPGIRKPKEHSFYITVCLLRAKSRGRVTLRSARPEDAPRIALNLFSAAEDFQTLRNGLRAARAIYGTKPQSDLIDAETIPGGHLQSDEEIDQAIREFGGITHHPVGTCAMGIGPLSVVDPQLRVRGLSGLRIADASVMPLIPGANTNAATVMIAEKAADLILGRIAPRVASKSAN